MSGLRIARVISRLNVGGPAAQLFGLTRALRAHGWQTDVYAGQPGPDEGDLTPKARAQGIHPHLIAGLSRDMRPGRDLLGLGALVWRLRRTRPALVHTHLSKAGLLGRVAAKLLGIPCVHTFHGHVLRGYFSPAVSRAFTLVEAGLGRASDAIIALSPRLREELVGLGVAPPERTHVIRAARDLSGFAPDPGARAELLRRHRLPADAVLVGMLGRLVPIKAPEAAVAAFGRVRDPRLCLLLAGDGPLRSELAAKIAASDLGGRCRLLGWQRAAPFLAGLDALLLCSHNEGTPLSLLEAFACGVPALATGVGGVPDMFSPGTGPRRPEGWLLPPGDASALDEALRWLLAHPDERREMREAARARLAVLDPDPARQAREHDRLYRALLARP